MKDYVDYMVPDTITAGANYLDKPEGQVFRKEYADSYSSSVDELTKKKEEKLQQAQQKKLTLTNEDLSKFSTTRSQDYQDGYLEVNRNALDPNAIKIPGVSSGYYPKALVESYLAPTSTATTTGRSKEELDKELMDAKLKDQGFFGAVGQGIAGIPSGLFKGAVELADVAQEIATYLPQKAVQAYTGNDKYDIDLLSDDTKKAIQKPFDAMVGYDRELADHATNKIIEGLKKSGLDITNLDSFKEAFTDDKKLDSIIEVTKLAVTNPGLITSGFAEFFGSAGLLGAGTKLGAKVAGKVSPEVTEKAGEWFINNKNQIVMEIKDIDADSTLDKAAKLEKISELEKSYTLSKQVPDLIRGSTMSNATLAVALNEDLDKYKENNNGESASPEKVLEMFIYRKVMAELETGVTKKLFRMEDLKGPESKSILTGALGTVVEDIAKVGGGTLLEAGQETLDGIVASINQKYESADYKDKSVLDILREDSAEILAGTVIGGVGGAGVSAGGVVLDKVTSAEVNSAIGSAIGKANEAIGNAYTGMVGTPEDTLSKKADSIITAAATPKQVTPSEDLPPVSADKLAELRAKMAARGLVVKEGESSGNLNKEAVQTVTTILGSDKDSLNLFRQNLSTIEDVAADIFATGDKESLEELKATVGSKLLGTTEGDAVYNEWLARTEEKGNALKVLSSRVKPTKSATGKTQEQVSQEAAAGAIGFLKHYNGAKISHASGNLEDRNAFVSSLDRMRSNAQTKLDQFEGAVEKVEKQLSLTFTQQKGTEVPWRGSDGKLSTEAKDFLELYVNQQQAKQQKGVEFQFLTTNYTTTNVDGSEGKPQKFRLAGYLAAKDILVKDGDEKYQNRNYKVRGAGAGAFKLIDQVTEELGAMNVLYGSLIREFSGESTKTANSTAVQVPIDQGTATKKVDTFENDVLISNQVSEDLDIDQVTTSTGSEQITEADLGKIWWGEVYEDVDSQVAPEWSPEFTEVPKDPTRRVENFGAVQADYGITIDGLGNEVISSKGGFRDSQITLVERDGAIKKVGDDGNTAKYRITGREAFKDVLTGLAQADEVAGDTRSIDWLQGHIAELGAMLEVVGDVDFTVGIIKPKKGGDSSYNLGTGEITLRGNSTEYSTSGTLLRELVNKLTYRGLEASPELKAKTNKLRSAVIDKLPEQDKVKVKDYIARFTEEGELVVKEMVADGLGKYTGLLDNHEMMTELVSNPEFRDVLSKIANGRALDMLYRMVSGILEALFGNGKGKEILTALDDARELLSEALVLTKQLEKGNGFTKVSGLMVDAVTMAKTKKEIDRKTANDIMNKIKNINPELANRVKASMAIAESENYNIAESGSMTTLEALKLAIIQEFKTIGEC